MVMYHSWLMGFATVCYLVQVVFKMRKANVEWINDLVFCLFLLLATYIVGTEHANSKVLISITSSAALLSLIGAYVYYRKNNIQQLIVACVCSVGFAFASFIYVVLAQSV